MPWEKNCGQFRLLMWIYCSLQQKKAWIKIIICITYPVIYGVMLFIVRVSWPAQFVTEPTEYPSFRISKHHLVPSADGDTRHQLAYTPNTTLTNRIVKQAAGMINAVVDADLAFDTEDDLIEYLKNDSNIFGGIVFLFDSNTSLPRNITYKIRLRAEMLSASKDPDWLTDHVYPSKSTFSPRQQDAMYGGTEPGHYHEEFLTVQQAVDLSIIKEMNKDFSVNRFELWLKQYPQPPYNDDWFIDKLENWLSFVFMFGFFGTGCCLCSEAHLLMGPLVKEKMKLMGVKPWISWCSWFVKNAIIVTISMILMTALLHIKIANCAIINYTFWLITFLFLFLYSLSLVSFTIAVSALFSEATEGAFLASVIYVVSCMPYFLDKNWSTAEKFAASLDFNMALAFGWRQICHFESIGVGVQFSNLAKPLGDDDNWTMLHVLGMLILDSMLYIIIAWYLDAMILGEIGTSQPCYFPFMRSYWCGHYNVKEVAESDNDDKYSSDQGSASGLLSNDTEEHFEKPLADAKVGIKIRGFTKKFTDDTLAVNNLNIDIYEGNITALVGPSGAGQSTTVFMLTGFLPPTDGNAYFNGMNIKYDMERIRENLGVCLSHDDLFDWLTVRENLIIFAKLKGCPSEEVDKRVSEMIMTLHLEDKADGDVRHLSHGLKRKLCVGIALIGDSKFVILDDPTSEMDPEVRRQTWDIIKSQQRGRTIILSTHFMDEADHLGDRIAIMVDGQIQCYGSPMFLKNKYGIGYRMTILKNANCDVDYLNEIIQKHVPKARLLTSVGAEVTFVLPCNESHEFEKLFARLENSQEQLGIESFGISFTTMEDVFFKVRQAADSTIDRRLQDSSETSALEGGQDSAFVIELRNGRGSKRHWLPFLSLFTKSCFYVLLGIISRVVLSFLSLFIISYVLRNLITFQGIEDSRPLYLNLSLFANPITLVELVEPSLPHDEAMKMVHCYEHVALIGGSVDYLNNKSDYNNMSSFLLSIAMSSIEQYNARYLTGATIETSESPNGMITITGWFNNAAYHSIAISLSQVTNTLMQCFGQKEYHIETINHPLPWINKSQIYNAKRFAVEKLSGIQYILPIGIEAFIFVCPILVNTDRITVSKLVSRAELFRFWFASFLGDFFTLLVSAIITIGLLDKFKLSPYTEGSAMWFFLLLNFIFFGFSVIPFIYILTFIFQNLTIGYYPILEIVFMTSFVTLFIGIYSPTTAKALEMIFYFTLPTFCFEKAFHDFFPLAENHRACSRNADRFNQSISCLDDEQSNKMDQCCSGYINYVAWEYPGIGRSLFCMAFQSIVLFLTLVFIENGALSAIFRKRKRAQLKAEIKNDEVELGGVLASSQDSDVLSETDRALNTPIADLLNTDLIIMQDLTKAFDDVIAVDKLSLGILSGECFGLLGANGAGKTTCFRILTGELKPCFGNAYVGGQSVRKNGKKVVPGVGYCPQSDVLLDQLSVRQTVCRFANLRGIPNKKRNQEVDAMIDRLMLKAYANSKIVTLSGENRRKLNVATALIGDPQIIFLDEPTTGMNSVMRRAVWNTLSEVHKSGRTLLLASNSLEECEALCTRIAIMVNGRFQCLGSIQHLKAKFTEGYTLIIKVGGTNSTEEGQEKVNQIKSFVGSTFPGSILKDHHEGLLNYQISTSNVSWSQIFGTIERAKHHLQIEDYSVCQTTLEHVFVNFARMQRATTQA